jgi:uncharacterized protein YecT (DUF1311 family)
MKINKVSLLIIVFLLFGCSSNPASSLSVSTNTSQSGDSVHNSCYQFAITQVELNYCAGQKAQASYAKLESLIAELKGHMNGSQYGMLLSIEENWEKAIAEHCKWEANFFEGGSIQPLQFAECLNQQYLNRVDELRLNLCEGNGMTGECEESLKYKE